MSRFLLHSDVIADYRGTIASPGAILLDGNAIQAVGSPQNVGHPEDATYIQVDGMITPSFVNAHSHLDLSGLGPVLQTESFADWLVEIVRPIRLDSARIPEHVRKGIELSLVGGSRVIGDIAGTQLAAEIVVSSELLSVSYVEVIGFGKGQHAAKEKVLGIPDQFDVSPHAPYTCSLEVYKVCFESGKKVSTHLSESKAELDFVQHHSGDIFEYLTKVDAWDETVQPWEEHPIDVLLRLADGCPFLAAHLNYIEDRHLAMIANSNMSVVYCPRASAYFGHIDHRWMELVAAGVNVALGTDSLLCLDTPDRISVLDEMRLLYKRDCVEANVLMQMATINGASALGIEPSLVTMSEGETAGLLWFDGIESMGELLDSCVQPQWVIPRQT